MEVGDTWLEHVWLLDVVLNILDEDLRSTTSNQVFLVRVEFDGGHRDSIMNVRCGDTSTADLQIRRIAASSSFNDFPCIPKGNSSIFHTSSNDTVLILEVNPVQG